MSLQYVCDDVVYEGVARWYSSLAKDPNNALVVVMFDGEPDMWLVQRNTDDTLGPDVVGLSNGIDTLKRIYAKDWANTGRKFEAHVYLPHSYTDEYLG